MPSPATAQEAQTIAVAITALHGLACAWALLLAALKALGAW